MVIFFHFLVNLMFFNFFNKIENFSPFYTKKTVFIIEIYYLNNTLIYRRN